jgi:hypothetical protein
VKIGVQLVRVLRAVRVKSSRLLRFAAILALVGLGFMVWSLLDPRPIPIMAAMSVGQGLGTVSFVIFLVVVLQDAWRANRKRKPDKDEGGG